MNIKKGDQVKILSGKDRGKTGKVLEVIPADGRVIVEGVNLLKKRVKSKQQGKSGEMVSVPRALNFSNAMIICKNCKKASRTGSRMQGDKKVRYCKKCDSVL